MWVSLSDGGVFGNGERGGRPAGAPNHDATQAAGYTFLMERPIPRHSLTGLSALNFAVAAVQTGFGPFVSVWLTREGWSQTDIGLALSLGTGIALVGQLPAGMLVDSAHHKRGLTAMALIMLAMSALLLAVPPVRPSVFAAEVLHAVASCAITPAIASMTLSLCGHAGFSRRLGVNASFSGLGNAAAAAGMGLAAWYFSERMVFVLAALLTLPALAAVFSIDHVHPDPDTADHPAIWHPKERDSRPWYIFNEPALHVFAVAIVLFQLGNAALLPLALNDLTQRGVSTGFVVSAAIMVPPVIVTLLSPWTGRVAQTRGRRIVLLSGFLALPVRALLFATGPGAIPLVAMQVLDGVSATVVGLMLPLIAADLTGKTGFLNLAIGSLGLAAGLGATVSTVAAGFVADRYGPAAAFMGLALVGASAWVLLYVAMPETRPVPVTRTSGPRRPVPNRG